MEGRQYWSAMGEGWGPQSRVRQRSGAGVEGGTSIRGREGERRESGCPLVQTRSPLPTSRDLPRASQRVSRHPVTGSEHWIPSATSSRGEPGRPPLGRLWSPAPPRSLQARSTQTSQVGGADLPPTFLQSGRSPRVPAASHPGPSRADARARAEAEV